MTWSASRHRRNNAVAIVEQLYQLDVSAEAASLRVPTLVMHSRNDARCRFEQGRQLAR
jgi:dipeptidyl aminopeptidase/acylaminoacyl peptidase